MDKYKDVINFMGEKVKINCTGCSIVNRKFKIPGNEFVYEGKYFIVAIDPEIPLEGFLVISAKEHKKSILDFEEEERNELMKLMYVSRKILRDLKVTQEITILQEERSNHFHVWIYPNYDYLTVKFGKGIASVREINEYIKKNATFADKENVIKLAHNIKIKFSEEII